MPRNFMSLVCLAAGLFAAFGWGAAARAQVDPVEDFYRELMRKPAPIDEKQLEAYKAEWRAYIQKNLRTIPQLRQATDRAKSVLLADSIVMQLVRLELKERIMQVAARGEPASQQAVAVLIGEMAGGGGDEKDRNVQFARDELWAALERLAENPDPSVRAAAIRSMGLIRPRALPPGAKSKVTLVPALAARLQKGPADERRLAAAALAEMMRRVNAFRVRSSTQSLADINDSWQTAAAIVPVARFGLRSADAQVRLDAAHALDEVGLFIAKAQPRYHLILDDLNNLLRSREFLASLTDPNPEIRLLSRRTLEHVADTRAKMDAEKDRKRPLPENAADGHLPLQRTSYQEGPVSWQADKGPKAQLRDSLIEAAKHVAATLNDPEVKVRLAAIDFLEKMADERLGADVVEAIVARTRDPNVYVRWAAARTLGQIGLSRLEKLEQLDALAEKVLIDTASNLAYLASPDNERDMDVRSIAARSLGMLARGAKLAGERGGKALAIIQGAAPALIAGARFGDRQPRVAALRALQLVGVNDQQAAGATRALVAMLADPEPQVRQATAETLGSFGPRARAAVPALEHALRDPTDAVRLAAADALLNIRR